MTRNRNMTAKFRAALRNELPIWIREGIVSEETAGHLSTTYQLANLKEESSRLLSAVIFTIGALLLGGGLISFVAANWEAISTPLKLTLLFSALLGFHVTGYWLWHGRDWTRLGHALIFCGCLVFGANIGLVAQIFHISGNWYAAFGAWALGSLVMAWAVRSWLIGLLVLGTSLRWFTGFQDDSSYWIGLIYPPVLAVTLVPLAWIIRSRVLYASTLLGTIIAACVLTGSHGNSNQVMVAMAAGGLFMWTLGELHRASDWRGEFASVTSASGLILLALTAYAWSFRDLWSPSRLKWRLSPLALLFLVLSLAATYFLLRRDRQPHRRVLIGALTVGMMLCLSPLLPGAGTGHRQVLFTIITNVAALILGSVIIGISLIDERRVVFWLGSLYLVLLILSRFLEYETSLLLKSAAFLACGLAVIAAGIGYEKYLRRIESAKRKEIVHE